MADVSKKRKIGLKLAKCKKGFIYRILVKINLILFHWKERRKYLVKKRKNKQTYYVIRSREASDGLLSTYFFVISHVVWALERDYIPVVKFDDETCQYYVGREINGTYNAWEYFFTQPCGVKYEDIPNDANILLSGWTLFEKNGVKDVKLTVDNVRKTIKNVCEKHCGVQPYIWEIVDQKAKELFDGNNTLGAFIRGTDYVALKPKGHYIQPTVDDLQEKIDEFLSKYEIGKIFVVTEDYDIYQCLEQKYRGRVFTSDDDFVKNYNTEDYLSASLNSDPYVRGLNYLIRVLLLAKCPYIVSSITNGSLFALTVKNEEYSDEYWFDLGLYP